MHNGMAKLNYLFFIHPLQYQLSVSEFNVRLSQSPNKGFIEVKDGSTWRKVNEERWDENRQKMLCQHLKFNETDQNNIITKNIGSGNEIATGDLICYGTQPSGTSCCIHLEPSISTSSTTVPYVTCGMLSDHKPLFLLIDTFATSILRIQVEFCCN